MVRGNGGLGRVEGKIAIVTGAGCEDEEIGIGRAIAILLAREGARVACFDLSGDRAETTVRMIHDEGGVAIALAGDVTRFEDCAAAANETEAAFGAPDILVNNVGIGGGFTLESEDTGDWYRTIDTNLTSAMLMCRAIVPRMAAAGGGNVVNISSVAGISAMGAMAYGPSKAGLHALTREIAAAYGRKGVRANTVAPGHMATPMVSRAFSPEMKERRRKIGPLGIEGGAWDIAKAVLFLASDDARFVNAVQLPVDGGVTAVSPIKAAEFLED